MKNTEKIVDKDNVLRWKVNTPKLLEEILVNPQMWALVAPLNIYRNLLTELAQHAIELNDPKLNAIMCRMALYEVSNPHSKDYDSDLTKEVIDLGYKKD